MDETAARPEPPRARARCGPRRRRAHLAARRIPLRERLRSCALRGSARLFGASLLLVACAACHPPDAVYDLAGNGEDTCGPGSIAEIADDFDDDTPAPTWAAYADPSATIAETNHQVEMSVDGTANAFAGYAWLGGPRSLLGCHVSVHVKQVAATSGGVLTYFSVPEVDGDGDIAFTHAGTSLQMLVRDAGAESSQSVPYDPVEQAWWRIREAGGAVHFETSPDGTSWLPQFTADTPTFAAEASVNVGMGVPFPPQEPGFAIIDNLNVEP